MPRAALSSADVLAFRARATAAATRLFARDGYEAVTMRAVADALGVSAMTPYRYVRNKAELFGLVRADAFRRFADHLEHALGRGGAPLARLRRLKHAYIRFALDDEDGYRIMFELSQPDPRRHAELRREARRAFGCLEREVEAAVRAGAREGDPLTVAHLLWASTHGLVSLHLAGKLAMGRSLEVLAANDHDLAGFQPRRKGTTR